MSKAEQSEKETAKLITWAQMIYECQNSGQTVIDWCAAHGINRKSYNYRKERLWSILRSNKQSLDEFMSSSGRPPTMFVSIHEAEEATLLSLSEPLEVEIIHL